MTIGLGADADVKVPEAKGTDVEAANDAFDALAWLIWPTDGLEGLLEAGAFRILSVDSEAMAESVDQGAVTWTVTAKLTDIDAPRRLATQVHPDEAG